VTFSGNHCMKYGLDRHPEEISSRFTTKSNPRLDLP
jgi:hypothetical protein